MSIYRTRKGKLREIPGMASGLSKFAGSIERVQRRVNIDSPYVHPASGS